MSISGSFPLRAVVAYCVVAILLAYPLWRYASGEIVAAFLLGGALALGNALLGYLTVEYAFEKSYTVFLRTTLGGMGARMIILLAAVLTLITAFHVHRIALAISLALYYCVYLVLEILYIQKKMTTKQGR